MLHLVTAVTSRCDCDGYCRLLLVLVFVNNNITFAGLLSRIVVRKTGRRNAEARQTVPVTVKVSDGEGADNGHVSVVGAEADVAREQFPFIFNLLRGHAINTQALAPGQVSVEKPPTKTSPHHQQQLQQQARRPAVTTCRQRQATPPGRGTLHCTHALNMPPSLRL